MYNWLVCKQLDWKSFLIVFDCNFKLMVLSNCSKIYYWNIVIEGNSVCLVFQLLAFQLLAFLLPVCKFWRGIPSSCLTNFASSLSPNKINFNISKVESGPWLNQFAQRWKVQILIFFWFIGYSFNFIFQPWPSARIVNPLPGKSQIGHNNLAYAMYTSTKETVRKRSTT